MAKGDPLLIMDFLLLLLLPPPPPPPAPSRSPSSPLPPSSNRSNSGSGRSRSRSGNGYRRWSSGRWSSVAIAALLGSLFLISHSCSLAADAAHSRGRDRLANAERTSLLKRRVTPKKSLSTEPSKCDASVKRLRSAIFAKEEEVLELREEATFLSKLAARTIRKGLHCLSLQLTIQYYNYVQKEVPTTNRTTLEDDRLYHYIIYSENILAAAVVVNSTISNAKEPQRHVFHILTDSLNYAAMQMWFWAYSPGKATVEIINLDDINTSNEQNRRKQLQLDTLQSSFLRVEEGSSGKQGILHYLPQIFPKLDKVFLLEDDIVILKDMSALWQLGTGNNMIIASDSCKASQEDGIWWSCVNIINLQECKNQRREEINPLPVDTSNLDHISLKGESSVDYLILDNTIHVLNIDGTEAQNNTRDADVVHYGGYAKPWLELGVGKYKSFWTRFLNFDNRILQECNVHK